MAPMTQNHLVYVIIKTSFQCCCIFSFFSPFTTKLCIIFIPINTFHNVLLAMLLVWLCGWMKYLHNHWMETMYSTYLHCPQRMNPHDSSSGGQVKISMCPILWFLPNTSEANNIPISLCSVLSSALTNKC